MASILIVDDEPGIRDLLSEILGEQGHVIELAENAAGARQARLISRPDLVLLDVWMPDMDGVSLLKEWSVASLLTMPVVMMSGHASVETALEAVRLGAHTFLEKPIALQKLIKTVNDALLESPASAAQAPEPQPQAAAELAAPCEGSAPAKPDHHSNGPCALQTFNLDQPLRLAKDEFEKAYFEFQLAKQRGSMTRVAEKAGLERTHLYRKLKQLGVNKDGAKNPV